MPEIGVRELKIHASEIIRKVKENGVHYLVTRRGNPVALITPVEEIQLTSNSEISAWEELVLLGQKIGENWQSEKNSVEILSEMRR